MTVAPALLARVDWRGRVLTGDARFCQRGRCRQVLEAGGDYLLLVRQNQPALHRDLALLFDPSRDAPAPLPLLDRREARTLWNAPGGRAAGGIANCPTAAPACRPPWPTPRACSRSSAATGGSRTGCIAPRTSLSARIAASSMSGPGRPSWPCCATPPSACSTATAAGPSPAACAPMPITLPPRSPWSAVCLRLAHKPCPGTAVPVWWGDTPRGSAPAPDTVPASPLEAFCAAMAKNRGDSLFAWHRRGRATGSTARRLP